ncbi:hypothetical protein [Acinetobacter kyonggiensis]|uniref:DUF2845 domain-containing protein n=1 Tax=Acinetobacter kyonggiensis TaxID=595670 RepID=A0A1H3L8C4_9GAMM|nr:hypothetical protein [Acinetobacter kyonggiensis]SDY60693.1 hypothetical protein SAMN05421643_11661 [Acinetobacter kyonggiensis]
MKIIILAILLTLSSTVFATSVDSVRGSFGFVSLNDSHNKMIDVLGDPKSSYSHVIHDRKGWPHKATTYLYPLDSVKYEITIVDGKVYSINWER